LMTQQPTFHENLGREQEVKAGSERALGIVFSIVFMIIALWPLIGDGAIRLWALIVAGAFLALGLIAPKLLKPLNWVWFRFGLLLHKIINPIIMALLFFTTVTPIALMMKIFGKDSLHRKFDASAKSYWIERQPPGPDPETMRNQF
jgi:large-conductance mechanosensitive channel